RRLPPRRLRAGDRPRAGLRALAADPAGAVRAARLLRRPDRPARARRAGARERRRARPAQLGAPLRAGDRSGRRRSRPPARPARGAPGELVCTRPFPSRPVAFWNDPGGAKYRAAYFEHFPGVWRHGDWIEITSRGTAVFIGRSDSTINRGGVRMGTSEIYAPVLALEEIVDALVVDVDGWLALFVVLRAGASLGDDLHAQIARRIREDCSPRHVPDDVFAVDEVPRTLSGKLLEVPVKRILGGVEPERAASRDSLANPAALDWFAAFARERTPGA
ncbi:MAG: hypothetical protein KY463_05595, partial [Actinobacteria bacterium]|nr:hypothetical protein [Actinomycetota bacterium]